MYQKSGIIVMIKVTTDSSSKYLTEIGAISRGNEVIAI